MGVGVADGAEAVIHAIHQYISQLPSGYAFIKLDFANAFNTLRRDLLLDTVARNTQALYRFTLATFSATRLSSMAVIQFRPEKVRNRVTR